MTQLNGIHTTDLPEAKLKPAVKTRNDSHTGASIETSDGTWVYPHPTDFKLSERYIDDVQELKVSSPLGRVFTIVHTLIGPQVCIIGAGLAGITAGVLLPAKVPGIELKILEKNSDVVSYRRYVAAMLEFY
jgi:hypothetical protein